MGCGPSKAKLVGTGAVGNAYQASSVALSASGNGFSRVRAGVALIPTSSLRELRTDRSVMNP
jgi:hypothetical protein